MREYHLPRETQARAAAPLMGGVEGQENVFAAMAGLLAVIIAIGTVAGHAFKVARANPIQALRYE